jgi:hypothetical protein
MSSAGCHGEAVDQMSAGSRGLPARGEVAFVPRAGSGRDVRIDTLSGSSFTRAGESSYPAGVWFSPFGGSFVPAKGARERWLRLHRLPRPAGGKAWRPPTFASRLTVIRFPRFLKRHPSALRVWEMSSAWYARTDWFGIFSGRTGWVR